MSNKFQLPPPNHGAEIKKLKTRVDKLETLVAELRRVNTKSASEHDMKLTGVIRSEGRGDGWSK